jgi:hypothetical protein
MVVGTLATPGEPEIGSPTGRFRPPSWGPWGSHPPRYEDLRGDDIIMSVGSSYPYARSRREGETVGSDVLIVVVILTVPALLIGRVIRPRMKEWRGRIEGGPSASWRTPVRDLAGGHISTTSGATSRTMTP